MAIERGQGDIVLFQPRDISVDPAEGFELAHTEAENVSGGGIFYDVLYPLLKPVDGVTTVEQRAEYLDKALFLGAAVDLDIDDFEDPEIEEVVDFQAELYQMLVAKTLENINRIEAIKARKITRSRGSSLNIVVPHV